jgi:hypothetical protein
LQTKFKTKIIYHDEVGFIPKMQGWVNILKSINKIQHINRIKDKYHMIISIDVDKGTEKIRHGSIINGLKKLGIEGMHLNLTKTVYEKPMANNRLNREKLKLSPLKSGMRQGVYSPHSCLT